jgi:hypothetical protein
MQGVHLSIYTKKSGRIIRFVGRLAMHFHVSRDDKIMEDFDEILSKSKRIFDCIESMNLCTRPALDTEIKNELKTNYGVLPVSNSVLITWRIGKFSGVEAYEVVRIATFKQGLTASMPVLDEPENLEFPLPASARFCGLTREP